MMGNVGSVIYIAKSIKLIVQYLRTPYGWKEFERTFGIRLKMESPILSTPYGWRYLKEPSVSDFKLPDKSYTSNVE
jgi:hypothetical protein